MTEEITIGDLINKTVEALLELGLATHTVWNSYGSYYLPIVKFHEEQGNTFFNLESMAEYGQKIEKRFENGEISKGYYNNLFKAMERITEVYNTGKLEWSCQTRISKFKLNNRFETILEGFMSWRLFHHNTKGDFIWVVRKYLAWLQQEGHDDINTITVKDISKFIFYCSQHLKTGSLHNISCYMKQFHQYLEECNLLSIPYMGVLSIPVMRRTRLLPALSQEELTLILNQIDKSTRTGKRDYAIILLGSTTGLRAVDIANMRLKDIRWRSGEIHVIQQKTGESLSLPLIPKVDDAIKEYILCGRPESDSEYLFLRNRAPFQKLNNGDAIGDMFDSYQKKAGIVRTPYDGKGFHSLRRLLGREMTIAEIPITTIAQVLGHSKTNSTTQYISLDSQHLKMCALDFRGITVERGDLLI